MNLSKKRNTDNDSISRYINHKDSDIVESVVILNVSRLSRKRANLNRYMYVYSNSMESQPDIHRNYYI